MTELGTRRACEAQKNPPSMTEGGFFIEVNGWLNASYGAAAGRGGFARAIAGVEARQVQIG